MKRNVAFVLAFMLCFSACAIGEEDLIGSWECVANILNGVLTEMEADEKELWVFWPDGTWQRYDGSVMDFTFTDDRIIISYEDPFSELIGYESRVLTKEYSYILDDDELVLIFTTVDGGSYFMIHQRESGEGLFGRWNRVAETSYEEIYQEWQNASTWPEEPILEFIDFYADGKCVYWQGCIPDYDDWLYDDWNDIPDLTLRYAASGENLTLTMGNDVYEVGYAFEEGFLVLIFSDVYSDGDGGELENTEEKVILSRVR